MATTMFELNVGRKRLVIAAAKGAEMPLVLKEMRACATRRVRGLLAHAMGTLVGFERLAIRRRLRQVRHWRRS